VTGNRIWNCPGLGLLAEGSRRLAVTGNTVTDCYKNPSNLPKGVPDAVIGIVNCTATQVTGNKVADTDAANVVWVSGSTGTTLRDNKATHKNNSPAAPNHGG